MAPAPDPEINRMPLAGDLSSAGYRRGRTVGKKRGAAAARPARIAALLASVVLGVCPASGNDEEVQRRNALEQAAALNQDPGGADRAGLLEARMKAKISAGLRGQRTAHPDAQWFGDACLGLFLHWGISSVHGGIDLSWPMIANMGSGRKLKPADYWKLADRFKAERCEPGVWLKAAREAGFDYAVLTAKHHDGFTLWPSAASEIGVRTSLPGRDLVKDFAEACRATGLKVGFYYSGPDWYKAKDYMSFNYRSAHGGNSSLPPIPGRPDFDTNWEPATVQKMPADVRARIQRECREQLVDLLTNYGKVDVLWFDGGSGSDITLEEIRALQPGIVINNRGGLRASKDGAQYAGDFFTVEHGEQPFRPPGWWEQLRIWNSTSWGYTASDETRYAPAAAILRLLARSKAWGGSVMANCGPRPDGAMPPPYYRGMAEVRDWMKANGESIRGASPVPESAAANVPVTTRGDVWYLHAVFGSKGKISVTPGAGVQGVVSARVLRTGEAIDFRWENGTLEVTCPERDRQTPHDVVAVTFRSR
jgi:alpha-L-fucosidase